MNERIQIKTSQSNKVFNPWLKADMLTEYAPVRQLASSTLQQAAELASHAIGAKVAAVCWVSSNSVRLITTHGLGSEQLARSLPKDFTWFAPAKISHSSEPSVVCNIEAFLGIENYQFVVSIPLWSHSGHVMGSILILDQQAHSLETPQLELLTGIANLAMKSINTALSLSQQEKPSTTASLLEDAVMQAKESVVAFDPSGKIFAWNTGAEATYGFSSQKMLGQSITVLIPNDDQASFLRLVQRLAHKPVAPHLVTRLHQSGFRIQVRSSLQAIYNAAGEVSGILEFSGLSADPARNVTIERFQSLVQHLPMLFLQTDTKAVLTFIEGNLLKNFQRGSDDLLGLTISEIFADQSEIQQIVYQALHGQATHTTISWRNHKYEIWVVPLLANSRIAGCNVLAVDISQQVETKQQLERVQSDLELVISQLPLLLVKADMNGQITSIHGGALNQVRNALAIGGHRAQVGNSLAKDLTEAPEALAMFSQASQGKTVNQLVQWRDQTFDAWVKPIIEQDQQTGTIAIALNVTERVGSQQALLEASRRIEQLLDSLPILAIAIDTNGCLTLLEGKGVKHFGGEAMAQNLLGTPLLEVFDDPIIANLIESALAGDEFNASFDFRDFTVEVFIRPILQAGVFVGANAVVIDTSDINQTTLEKRQTQEALLHTQTELAQQQAFAQMVLETIEQGVTVNNEAGVFEYVSPVYARMLGYEPEELIGLSPTDLVINTEEVKAALQERNEGWRTVNRYTAIHKDGSQLPIEVTGYPRHDRHGNLVGGGIGFIRDISLEVKHGAEISKIQRQLQAENEFTSKVTSSLLVLEQKIEQERDYALSITNGLQAGLVVTNSDLRFEYINPAFTKLFGYTLEDLQSKHPSALIHPDDHQLLELALSERRSGQAGAYRYRILHKDGHSVFIEGYGSPRYDSHGQWQGTIATIYDISEQLALEQATHQARRALERESRTVTLVANAITEGLLFVSPESIVEYANPGAVELLGCGSSQAMIGLPVFTWVIPEDLEALIAERQFIHQGQTRTYRFGVKRIDGSIISLEGRSYPRLEQEIFKGSIILLRDISAELEQKRLEAEQRRALAESENQYRELYEQSYAQTKRLELIDTIRNAASFADTTQKLIQDIVVSISQTLEVPMVSIYLLEQDQLVLQHAVGYQHTIAAHAMSGRGVMVRSIKNNQVMLINDASLEPDFVHLSGKIQSELCVPITNQKQVLGVINLESTETYAFSEADANLILQIAERISGKIQMTHVLDELRAFEQTNRQ